MEWQGRSSAQARLLGQGCLSPDTSCELLALRRCTLELNFSGPLGPGLCIGET